VLEVLAFVLAAVAVIVVAQVLADKTGLPAAALLTVSGLIHAFLPGPSVRLDPDVILTFVIPPPIYSAALNSSPLAIRKNLRVVISLSIGLVLATALVVGVGIDLFVPGVGLAAGHHSGRCCCPARPGGRAGGRRPRRPAVPAYHHHRGRRPAQRRHALTTLTVAVSAATSGGFSVGAAVLRFLVAAADGLLAGVIVAIAVRGVRTAVRDPCSPGRPAVMITGHVPAVRLAPDHADRHMAAAIPARGTNIAWSRDVDEIVGTHRIERSTPAPSWYTTPCQREDAGKPAGLSGTSGRTKAGPAWSGAPEATTSMPPRPGRRQAGGGARELKHWASRPGS
jgi:hypothetical protein